MDCLFKFISVLIYYIQYCCMVDYDDATVRAKEESEDGKA